MKKRIMCLWICAILILLCGCKPLPHIVARHPTSQPGTTWATADGKISFHIDADFRGRCHGIIETENGSLEIVFSLTTTVSLVNIALASDYAKDETKFPSIATGQGSSISREKFRIRITAIKDSCPKGLFELEQEFIFYKITDI